jgi:hypothetical protein
MLKKYCRPEEAMRITWWLPSATNTQTEYVIVIDFALQHWFHECASMLHYLFIACLVFSDFKLSNSDLNRISGIMKPT